MSKPDPAIWPIRRHTPRNAGHVAPWRSDWTLREFMCSATTFASMAVFLESRHDHRIRNVRGCLACRCRLPSPFWGVAPSTKDWSLLVSKRHASDLDDSTLTTGDILVSMVFSPPSKMCQNTSSPYPTRSRKQDSAWDMPETWSIDGIAWMPISEPSEGNMPRSPVAVRSYN